MKNDSIPPLWEVVDALVGMACQYLDDSNGNLRHDCISAGENTVDVLDRLGLLVDGKIIAEAYNSDWLSEKFSCEEESDTDEESRECGCGWSGPASETLMCGSVGPLCPECRETTEIAEARGA